MTSHQNLMLYGKLSGFRLLVLANRLGCNTDFLKDLHDRLLEGLEVAIARIQTIMELEWSAVADEFSAYQLYYEAEAFGQFTIDLLDVLEIDVGTYEYRINGGNWINALKADEEGVDIEYPELMALTENELGSLAQIMQAITRETGIPVRAARVT